VYDVEGRPRDRGALVDVLGVRYTGHVIGGLAASYGRIERAAHTHFAGIGETQFVPNELGFCNVQPADGTEVLLTLVPPFAPLGGVGAPPERASIPTDKTDVPLAVQRGRCVTFAHEIGRLEWRFRLPDHARLIANAVRAAAPRPYPAELEGAPFGVQLSLFQQPGRLLCHLVNACGAGTVRHEVVALHDLRLRVPTATRRARALALGQDLPVADGRVTVPVLHTWEIVALEV
jgi:hypothetical protein